MYVFISTYISKITGDLYLVDKSKIHLLAKIHNINITMSNIIMKAPL